MMAMFLIFFGKFFTMGNHILQRDLVLHQQSDFDIHEVEVVLQLLVGTDEGDDLLAHLHEIKFLLEVLITLVQEVDKLSDHNHRRVLSIDESLVVITSFVGPNESLDFDNVIYMVSEIL